MRIFESLYSIFGYGQGLQSRPVPTPGALESQNLQPGHDEIRDQQPASSRIFETVSKIQQLIVNIFTPYLKYIGLMKVPQASQPPRKLDLEAQAALNPTPFPHREDQPSALHEGVSILTHYNMESGDPEQEAIQSMAHHTQRAYVQMLY